MLGNINITRPSRADSFPRRVFAIASRFYCKNTLLQSAAVGGVRVGRNPLYFGRANIAERPIKQFLSLIVPVQEYGKLIYQCENVAPLDGAVQIEIHPVRSHDPKHRATQLF